MKKVISHSVEETERIAADWLRKISSAPTKAACVAGLSGHLGAGKTAFVKAVGKALGIEGEITSPTFVIMKIYATTHSRFKKLVHIDAYRLEKAEELEVLGLGKLISDPRNIILIEWPENVKEALNSLTAYEHIQ